MIRILRFNFVPIISHKNHFSPQRFFPNSWNIFLVQSPIHANKVQQSIYILHFYLFPSEHTDFEFSITGIPITMAMNSLKMRPCFRPLLMRSISSLAARHNLVDDKTGIATVVMDRPPVNSLNTALLQDLPTALTDVSKNYSKGHILNSVCVFMVYHSISTIPLLFAT